MAAAVDSIASSDAASLSPLELEFLETSRALQESEVRNAHAAVRRLRVLLTGTAVALVIALVAGTLAVAQRSRARHQAVVADAARLAAQSRLLSPAHLDVALLLGVESHRLDPSIATEGGLEAALGRVPAGLDRLVPIDRVSGYAGMSSDGRVLAAPGTNGTVRLIDVASGRVSRTLHDAGAAPLLRLAGFSPDNRLVATGSNQGTVAIWDSGTGEQIGPPLRAGDGPVNGVFDAVDNARVFTVSTSAVVRWDIHDHRHPVRVGEPLSFPAEPTRAQRGAGQRGRPARRRRGVHERADLRVGHGLGDPALASGAGRARRLHPRRRPVGHRPPSTASTSWIPRREPRKVSR